MTQTLRHLPYIGLLLLFALQLTAQDYHVQVQHFSIDEGLSHREVHDVFQDSRGLIWISTLYGLNRFDGQRFTWFTKEKQGLSSNHIQQVVEDAQGWLWVFSSQQGGETGWDFVDLLHSRKLELQPWADRQAPFSPSDIRSCIANAEREIFFGTKNGECWKLDSIGAFVALPFRGVQNFTPTYYSSRGTIWGVEKRTTQANLLEVSASGEVLQKFVHAPDGEFSIGGEDAMGRLWYTNLIEGITNAFIVHTDGRREPYGMAQSPLGEIIGKMTYNSHYLRINPVNRSFWWTGGSTFAISDAMGKQVLYLQERYPGLGLSNDILFDKSGGAWNGTIDGIYWIKFEPSKFKNLLSLPFEEAVLNKRIECRGILETASGEVIINSYAGTFSLSREGKVLSNNFLGVPQNDKWASMTIYPAPDGDTWFGWLCPIRQDEKTGMFTKYSLHGEKRDLNIWAIYQQPNGRMWFAGLNGDFTYLEPGADTVQWFKNYEGFEELKKANILAMQERTDGKVWLAANTGLYLFDPVQLKILQRYWTGGEGPFYLPNDNIHHLYQDGDSLLWLATGGGGLIKLAAGSTQFTNLPINQFTKSDGLSSNVLYAVYPDDYGNLWLSSDYGIIQFNKETHLSKTFLTTDGLPHHEFNRISHHQTADGQLYFGSLNGVTTFHPRDFHDLEVVDDAPLVLLGLEQFNGRQNQLVNKLPEYMEQPEIVLRPGDRVVNLEFALLDYNAPERIRYAYRVEGVDEEWTYLRENRISLSGLPYGEHVLKIKGQAATGVFSSQQLSIPLRVLRPFYLKTWFLILVALALLVAGPAFYKLRTQQLKWQKHRLELEVKKQTEIMRRQNRKLATQAIELRHLDEVKSRFFSNVSHELRTPLTLLLGPIGSVLKGGQLDNRSFTLLKKAQRSGKDLLQLINEILDLSKMESGKMELHEKAVRLYPLLQRCFAQFESHARLQDVQLVFEYQASEELQVLLDVDKFEKVVNNFLSNAVKFTPKDGRVTLRLEESDSRLLLTVADTGQGIHSDDVPHVFDRFYQTNRPGAPAEGGTGIGLALVNEYAQLSGGKTWVESTLGQGSTFFFEFPKKLVAAGDWEELPVGEELEEMETFVTTSEASEKPATADRPTVLIVEDNPELRDYLRLILEEKYKVITVENGQIALEKLTANGQQPIADLILSDLMMPVMDGYQLLEKLKSDDRYRHLPVVMLTARADLRDRLKALRIGVDDYLLKPFEEEELLVRIENLLTNYRNRQSAEEAAAEAQMAAPSLSQADVDWLAKLETHARDGLGRQLLSVNWLANQVHLSKSQLLRRLRKVTGLTAQQYLIELRLQESRELLRAGKYSTIAEVAYAVGYKDAAAFSRSFRNYFGKSPSEFLPH